MMAEEEKPLEYIPEVILKKRKKKDEIAITRRKQLELGNHGKKKHKVADIKRPEELVAEFRAKELDLIRMKQREKRPRAALRTPKSNLLFIVRIQGKNDMHPKLRKVLHKLGLRKTFTGIFAKTTDNIMEILQKVEPYVTFGYPNLKTVHDLIFKKGFGRTDKKRVPLTDNNIIEEELGKHGILCIEDMVHQIVNVGPHFKEVIRFLGPLQLNKPQGLQGKKRIFKDGGETGNREDQINDLIAKMN